MKKSIFNIKLMNGPRGRNINAEDSMNGARLDDRREGFIIVDAMLLRVTATNPPSFVAWKRPIRMDFLSENPCTRNNVDTGRTRCELPGLVLNGFIAAAH
jgi:hypothetical protein